MWCHLFEGRPLAGIWWEAGVAIELGKDGVEAMRVVPIAGLSGWTPWIQVVRKGQTFLHNAAQLSGVRFVDEDVEDAVS